MTVDLDDLLSASFSEIAAYSPSTVVYTQGGTRRSAVLAGIAPESDAYIRWVRKQLFRCLDLIFKHGVNHIFVTAITPDNFRETGSYRKRLFAFTEWALSGKEALTDYKKLGWRVRLLGSEDIPELQPTANRLVQKTADISENNLWCLAVSDEDAPWRWLFSAINRSGARTRKEAIIAQYGQEVSPITMLLSTGKPVVSTALLPPLLVDKVQCYWRQRPGHNLTQAEFRTILHDFACLRSTWQQDKTGRAEQALQHQDIWERGPVLGVGQRLGPFWYPAPIPPLE